MLAMRSPPTTLEISDRPPLLVWRNSLTAFAVSPARLLKGGNMSSTHNPGRVAGFLYLLLVPIAPIRLMYIPNALFVGGNATATANNIAAHQSLFRLGIVCDLLAATLTLFLVLALTACSRG